MSEWRSLHVFFDRRGDCEIAALGAAQAIRACAVDPTDWFFIRYSEGGPHVRIRLGRGAIGGYEGIRSRLQALAAAFEPATPDEALGGFADAQGRMFERGSVVDIDYVPETRRYGGRHALDASERLFRISTAIAIKVMAQLPDQSGDRKRRALDLLRAAAAAVLEDGEDPIAYLGAYHRGWTALLPSALPHASAMAAIAGGDPPARYRSFRTFLQSGGAARSLSQHWARALRGWREEMRSLNATGLLVSPSRGKTSRAAGHFREAVADISFSHIHMLNNRLGFAPYQEAIWSEALAARLETRS